MISISLKTDRRTLNRVDVVSVQFGDEDTLEIFGTDVIGDPITEATSIADLIDVETRACIGTGSIRVLRLVCGTGQDMVVSSEQSLDGGVHVFCGAGDVRTRIEDVKLGDILAPDQRRFLMRMAP
jgi:hypothetical protein